MIKSDSSNSNDKIKAAKFEKIILKKVDQEIKQ